MQKIAEKKRSHESMYKPPKESEAKWLKASTNFEER